MKFADQDERYSGHRFCRQAVTELDRNNTATWFYNPDQPSREKFLPTIESHAAAAAELLQRLKYNHSAPVIGKDLRILCIGDSITWGYQSSEGSGFRKPLYQLLTPENNVSFIGTQTCGNGPLILSEGYPDRLTQQIYDYIKGNDILSERPNVITLMSGINDVNRGSSWALAPAIASLDSMVDFIMTACPDAVLLISHILPIGFKDFGWPLSTTMQRVALWNAGITEMINRKVAQHPEWHILKVHTTATVYDHANNDGLHPSDFGYQKTADDWAERLSDAADLGWIGAPVPVKKSGLCHVNPTWYPQGSIFTGTLGPDAYPSIICTNT
jgi:lysophospholipase L1-like esterase